MDFIVAPKRVVVVEEELISWEICYATIGSGKLIAPSLIAGFSRSLSSFSTSVSQFTKYGQSLSHGDR